MEKSILSFLWLLLCSSALHAETLIRYTSLTAGGSPVEITAVISPPTLQPAEGRKLAAVILLHSKGGWQYPVTEQYAKALSAAGFMVMEPRLFADASVAPPVPPSILPMVYDALRYLAERGDVDPQRIGVAGFSYGGALAIHSAASWAQQRYAAHPELKFAAHAPFYPVCWAFASFAQGKRKSPSIPVDAFTSWTGAPVRIFAAGRDNYDDNDPNTCAEFVTSLPAAHQPTFSVQLYAEATHGWDQKSATFYEAIACKGRGCNNTNRSDAKITQQSIRDLVDFMSQKLAPTQ